jgi:transposase
VFIECVKNNGVDYLRIIDGFKYKENGKLKHKRRVVKNIGPLSRFSDGQPEYLARLRKSFKAGKPLIAELEALLPDVPIREKITVEFDVSDEKSYCAHKNCGYFILDSLYGQLGIYDVINSHKSRKQLKFDINGCAKLLCFGRFLSPNSKLSTFAERERYLFPITKSEKPQDIYDTFSELSEKSESIQKRMNLKIRQTIGRDTEVCFYDVTNYYFEIGENDPDKLDAAGNVIEKGLRKKGVSKEKRGEPIVQMGLFIDDNGIPVSYRLFPGNNTDTTTLRPAMKKTVDNMEFGRVIIVADDGLNSGRNIAHILDVGNGYIISKSTKKSDKNVKAWMLLEDGYEWNEKKTFKSKSIIRKREIKDENGKTREITEKLVCYWSKKHYDHERHENEKFIEYLESIIAFPDKLKDKPRKIEKFLKKIEVDKATGEIADTATVLLIDMEKVREYFDLMGYYTIMTSETGKPDKEIISKYHGLSRIEDSFRVTKSDLEGRPVFVRTPEHINAHFLTCFIALVMVRIIQHKILKFQGKDTKSVENWELGLSAERIQNALREWQADALPGGYYRTTRPSPDLALIFNALNIEFALPIATTSQLFQLKYLCYKHSLMC